MAKIDKLIAMMAGRKIQCALLISDKPSRFFVAGQESAGPVIESAKLSAIIAEITPDNLRSQWEQRTAFLFPYQSEQGAFDIGVRYENDTLNVTIAHHVDQTVAASSKRRSTLAAPSELRGDSAAWEDVARAGVEKPRLSQLSQIVGLCLLAALVGFGMIILVLRAAGPLDPSQLSVIKTFVVLWGGTAIVWAAGCFRVASSRAQLEALLPPGYQLTPAEKLQQALAQVPDFEITQQFIEPGRHSAIAIDEIAKKICFISVPTVAYHEAYLKRAKEVIQSYRAEHKVKYVAPEKVHEQTCTHFPGYDPDTDTRRGVYPFRSILESRLLEDGNTLFKTARTSPVGSALIDNLMTSKAGNIVDKSIVDASSQPDYKTIDLRILTNDQKEPVHMLHFLHVTAKDSGPIHRTAMRQAEHCHSFVSELINSMDAEDKAAEIQQQKEMHNEFLKNAALISDSTLPPSIAAYATKKDEESSVADQLQKLVDLRSHEAITQEEFDTLKAKLLSAPTA